MRSEGGSFSSIRSLGKGPEEDSFVVELTTPVAANVLLRSLTALQEIGVQVLHTRVRATNGKAVQILHLAEQDDARLDARRMNEALVALSALT